MMNAFQRVGWCLFTAGVWIAEVRSAQAQSPLVNVRSINEASSNLRVPGAFALAAAPSATAARYSPSLTISALKEGAGEVRVLGVPDTVHQIEISSDLKHWILWSAKSADAEGRSSHLFIQSPSNQFFRASAFARIPSKFDGPEVALGKRLFLETRFAQFFFAHSSGNVNSALTNGGDPVLSQTVTLNVSAPGSFRGQSMSCKACHLTDEQMANGLGYRAHADFSIRSPIPDRGDGRHFTLRNTPALVNASIARSKPFFLHFDGEFLDGRSLVKATLTGRNFGWLLAEYKQAVSHIAKVIREDDGRGFLGPQFGGPYRILLSGLDPSIPDKLRLPAEFRLDVSNATDTEILETVARLVEAYMHSLSFATDKSGDYVGSPYDLFLKKNSLPRRPAQGQDDLSYSRLLRALVGNLKSPAFVTSEDGSFKTHNQNFSFGAKELEGMRIFLAEPAPTTSVLQGKAGNCIACHAAPHFTDFDFHNTGSTQWEYDSVHGEGAFSKIAIPGLAERQATHLPNAVEVPTLPSTSVRFDVIPTKGTPGSIDLGLWNVYANPNFSPVQTTLQNWLSARFGSESSAVLLPKTMALFKTPGLRDLGHSAPYLHTGQSSTIESVIFFYRFSSDLARANGLRNGSAEIGRIFLSKEDQAPLAAFLRALNEDLE